MKNETERVYKCGSVFVCFAQLERLLLLFVMLLS